MEGNVLSQSHSPLIFYYYFYWIFVLHFFLFYLALQLLEGTAILFDHCSLGTTFLSLFFMPFLICHLPKPLKLVSVPEKTWVLLGGCGFIRAESSKPTILLTGTDSAAGSCCISQSSVFCHFESSGIQVHSVFGHLTPNDCLVGTFSKNL